MKNHFYIIIIIAMCMFMACQDGEVGPAGPDGANGTNGTNGTNGLDGQDGENGEGYDQIAKYGNIMVYLDGMTPEDVVFKDTSNFKFASIGYLRTYNIINIGETSSSISVYRFLSTPDDIYQASRVTVSANITEEDGNFTFENFSIFFFKDIVTTDFKVFDIANTFNSSTYTDLDISNYSYDPSTGSLQFTFSFNVSGSNNATGNDLTVSGEVDIIILENLDL
ncbi:hypothetical protein [Fulvivirga ligni]|uniref:hypothetical protein n=1 Tax=Fulvivirga ligni TaxID=2904246 RepID=UPI001F3FA7F9|nr:hypothetical protein [Fulvivirga ligni]UII21869.1 hypothetical protein LVD16_01300 [Fulvivirga ligni]